MLTLPERLRRAAQSPSGIRFVDRRESETFVAYEQIERDAAACAASLRHAGVRAGDRVAIVLPSGAPFYHAMFGAMALGAIATPIYPPTRLGHFDAALERLTHLLRAIAPKVVVSQSGLAELLQPAIEAAVVPLGCVDAGVLLREGRHDSASSGPRYESQLDAVALIQFSSGTTGVPKPVALTHRQIGHNVDAIVRAINDGIAKPDGCEKHTTVSWLPLYHDMGLMGAVLGSLSDQSSLVLLGPELFVARPAAWLRALTRHRGSVSAAPNFAYGLCADKIGDEQLAGLDLSSWRLALNGAEPVCAATMRRFAQKFSAVGFQERAFAPVYGLAEASLAVTFPRPGTTCALPQSAELPIDPLAPADVVLGEPLPGYEVRIVSAPVDPSAAGAPRVVANGQSGLVQVRGPSIAAGYWHADGIKPCADADGWLSTNDLGRLDGAQLVVEGRAKDVLMVRGQKYAPQHIERAISELEHVRRGCVVVAGQRRHAEHSDSVFALVETRLAGKAKRVRLRAAIAEAMGRLCSIEPREVVLLPPGTLLRTSSGKLRRADTLTAWQARTLTPPVHFPKTRLWWRRSVARLRAARLLLGAS